MNEKIDDVPRSLGPRVPPELLEACERGELILCVGPELGRRAELPDTSQLALELLADVNSRDIEVDDATLRDWVGQGRTEEVLEVLERRMGTRFQRVAERVLGDRSRPLPALSRSIAALSDRLRAVYTTGIDRLLERAFADAWPSFSSPRPDVARRSKLIFKLCGTLEFPETWVLTQAAFEREFGERSLRRQLLTTVFRAHCLLFIGFDPDEALTRRLFSCIDSAGGEAQLPDHFIVLERCAPERRVMLERRGLHVIVGHASVVLEALGRDGGGRERSLASDLPKCPYPGLRAFDSSLAGVFHGRCAEISQAAVRLGGPERGHRRWLAVEGSSGVGKSSFVHAGLIPALGRGFAERTPARWLVTTIRPGRQPLRALIDALETTMREALEPSTVSPIGLDAATPARVAEFVHEHTPAAVALLLVIDQLEELVTLAAPDERDQFVECLVLLIGHESVYLVTTLRSDFNSVLASASATLARLLNDHAERYTLAPISRVGLRAGIVEPAAQLGVAFEDELVERIASDAEQHFERRHDDGDCVVRTDDAALPLVAHVLRALWDAHDGQRAAITFDDYMALGGVSGALSRNADALLTALDRRQQARVKALLLRMTGIDGDRLVRRSLARGEALALAGGGREGEWLLGRLSGAGGPRLLVVRGEGEDAIVDLIHEALLREWDTLRGWIAADRGQLARDEALAMRAAAWIGQGRPWRSLPRGPERRELARGRPQGRDAERQREYQRAMRRAALIRTGAWMGLVAGLSGLGAFVGMKLEDAEVRDEQRQSELDTLHDQLVTEDIEFKRNELQEQIKDSLAGHRCHAALREVLNALEEDPVEALRPLLSQAVSCEAIIAEQGHIEGSGVAVTALGVDTTGQDAWIGRSDGSVDRWRMSSHEIDHVEGLAQRVDYIRISTSGDRVALSARGDGTTALRGSAGEVLGTPLRGGHPIFSPDGRYLATRQTKKLNLYDSVDGDLLWSMPSEGTMTAFEFAPAGDAIIHTSSAQGGSEVVVLDAVDGSSIKSFFIPSLVRDIAISPDGRQLASLADDNYARRWDIFTEAEAPGPLELGIRNKSLAFVLWGPTLVTLATNDSIAVEDLVRGVTNRVAGIDPHTPPIFAPNGRWLLTAGSDGVVNVRSPAGAEVARAEVEDLQVMAVSPLSDSFVTASADGVVTQWKVDLDDHWRDLAPHRQSIKALAFSPTNPRQLASGSSAGTVRAWTIGAAEDASRRWQQQGWAVALAFSPDGAQLTSFSDTKVLRGELADSKAELEVLASGLCASKLAAVNFSGGLIAIACSDGRVELWDSVRQLRRADSSTELEVTAIAVSDRGDRVVLGGSSGAIEVLKVAPDGGEQRTALAPGHKEAVTSVAFARGGDRFVTGGNDGLVRRWMLDDLAHPLELRMVGKNIEAVAISDKPAWVAAGDDKDGVVIVWDDEGDELLRFDRACPGRAAALQFSSDGQRLAVGCTDGTVHAWPIGEDAQIELACQRLAHISSASELPEICLKVGD